MMLPGPMFAGASTLIGLSQLMAKPKCEPCKGWGYMLNTPGNMRVCPACGGNGTPKKT